MRFTPARIVGPAASGAVFTVTERYGVAADDFDGACSEDGRVIARYDQMSFFSWVGRTISPDDMVVETRVISISTPERRRDFSGSLYCNLLQRFAHQNLNDE